MKKKFLRIHKESKAMMLEIRQRALETIRYLRQHFEIRPVIGLLTGTGLGESTTVMDISTDLDYKDIPHFPVSTVESHAGRLLAGRIEGRTVIAMQGRFHLYEGYSALEVTYPVRIMQELGVKVLIVSNAAGGLNSAFAPGDIMIIRDHLNLTGENPLVGPNQDAWGLRFPDMTHAYDPQLIELTQESGRALGLQLPCGVYAGLKGPSLETPAEARYLKIIGAEAVGFSTVPEVIAAVHAGLRVLGLSIVTNVHNPDDPRPASVSEIIATAAKTAPLLGSLIARVVKDMPLSV